MDDLISRQAAIDALCDEYCGGWQDCKHYPKCENLKAIQNLPPAQPATNCSEIPNGSDDTISRQAAIDIAKELTITIEGYEMHNQAVMNYCAEIIQLPPIQPKRGKWIKTARWGRVYYCDQCRNYLDFDGVNAGRGSTNFCPNCGAKMEVNNEIN